MGTRSHEGSPDCKRGIPRLALDLGFERAV
jgi:hypothetical protein